MTDMKCTGEKCPIPELTKGATVCTAQDCKHRTPPMPDIKEKLVGLLKRTEYQFTQTHSLTVENVADDLFSHGVTIQQWISVEERLPKSEGSYLVYRKDAMGQMYVDITGYYYGDLWTHIWRNEVTHWMPLPAPPKGEHDENNL